MSEIIAAIDEAAANELFDTAVAGLPTQTSSGSSTLGPFTVAYTASGTLSNGDVDLIAPGTVRITDLRLDWTVNASFQLDLGDFLPDIHIPQVCFDIPCVGRVCTPRIDIVWPTVTVPITLGDFLKASVDLGLVVALSGGVWEAEAVVQGVPSLTTGIATVAMVTAIGAAVALAVAWVPLIGPFLALLVAAVTAVVGVAALTGLLGPILTPFVAGTRIPIYTQPQLLQILPVQGPHDPAVSITLDAVAIEVQHNSPEDELVLLADISA
ncbi:hypothetical protein [Nocardioides sp.]|uniref:hypothetical protein n=1 Tax=Nocardioides sp. TaxID=35761 RepID=UPI002734364B|nr:hypothetical protein [Nocardioides sp.]MDP3893747.1 hypothetical protein [Nocardioides sp.]